MAAAAESDEVERSTSMIAQERWARSVFTDVFAPRAFGRFFLRKLAFTETWNIFDLEEERKCSASTFARRNRTLVRASTGSSSADPLRFAASTTTSTSTSIACDAPSVLVRLTEHVDAVEHWTSSTDDGFDFIRFSLSAACLGGDGKTVVAGETLVSELMHNFGKGRVLDGRQIVSLLRQTIKHLEATAATVTDVQLGSGERRLVIVGDLHGQLPDLLTILRMNGLPGPSTVYLFNGDFVDRGRYGLEVVLLLFAALLTWPGAVHLNRGNHEDVRMNIRYNFASEVGSKCQARAPKVFQLVHEAFRLLPLVTVVDGELAVVHGGLYDVPGWGLDDIRTRLNRRRDVPTVAQTDEDAVFQGLLWSDPRPIEHSEASRRGAGIHFGRELTTRWMQANGVRTLVRSHELCEKGYDLHHGLKVITVFSASRYCNKNDNFGAFLLIRPDAQPEVHRYRADACPGLNASFAFTDLVRDVIRMIGERVYDARDALAAEFAACDGADSGTVSRADWAAAMRRGTGLHDVPFLLLQPNLVRPQPDGRIHWRRYLNRFRVRIPKLIDRLASDTMWSVCQQLYTHSDSLASAFAAFDSNADGGVDAAEFRAAIQRLHIAASERHIDEIFATLDADGDGKITAAEFLAAFTPVYSQISAEHRADVFDILKRIARAMRQRKRSIKQAFADFDADGDGRLSYDELVRALAAVLGRSAHYQPASYLALARFMDADHSGSISYDEFRNSFRAISKSALPESLTAKAVDNLVALFRRNAFTAVSAFALFDEDFSGTINKSEFHRGFDVFNDLLDHPLTPGQIETLWQSFERNDNGELDYRKFCECFQVQDSHNQS